MKYTGDFPCPGCHNVVRRSGKYSLCDTCERDLIVGKQLQKDYDLRGAYTYVTSTWYKLQFRNNHIGETGAAIEKAFYDLLDAMHRSSLHVVNGISADNIELTRGEATTASKRVTIRTEYALAIKALVDALQKQQDILRGEYQAAIEDRANVVRNERNKIYSEGIAAGKQLLMQLNKGDITMTEFEQNEYPYHKK